MLLFSHVRSPNINHLKVCYNCITGNNMKALQTYSLNFRWVMVSLLGSIDRSALQRGSAAEQCSDCDPQEAKQTFFMPSRHVVDTLVVPAKKEKICEHPIRLSEWLIDWLIEWLVDCLLACLIDWLNDWLIACLLDWLISVDSIIQWFRHSHTASCPFPFCPCHFHKNHHPSIQHHQHDHRSSASFGKTESMNHSTCCFNTPHISHTQSAIPRSPMKETPLNLAVWYRFFRGFRPVRCVETTFGESDSPHHGLHHL